MTKEEVYKEIGECNWEIEMWQLRLKKAREAMIKIVNAESSPAA